MRISDLKGGERIDEVLLCSKLNNARTKFGREYFNAEFSDSSGKISAKIWNIMCVHSAFGVGDAVRVTAAAEVYQGSLQLDVSAASRVEEYDVKQLFRKTPYDVDEMLDGLLDCIQRVKNEWCVKLLEHFFADPDFREEFCNHSAAVSVHHDYVGGLLEHTYCVVKTTLALGELYPALNQDLMVTAAALHDVGKLHEIGRYPQNVYTVAGECIGHITEGAMMVREACDAIPGFPEEVKNKILHCILAHHGRLEWGSPKIPALAEAVIVSRADELDSILKIFEDATASGEWKEYNRYLEVKPGMGTFHEEA